MELRKIESDLISLVTHSAYLDVSTNKLSGSIPVDLMARTTLSKLSWKVRLPYFHKLNPLKSSTAILNMADNTFTGVIPTEIGNMADLAILTLSNNFLTGTFTTEIGMLKSLSEFSMQFVSHYSIDSNLLTN